jgi:uncharacterized protein (DUF1697 family)
MKKTSKTPVTVFVALLRAVNVGGKNIISMPALKASFEKIGFTGVTTYINSGNVIFKTKEVDQRKIERNIERMLSKDYHLESKVVVRNLSEMANLVASLPASWNGDPRYKYNVIFLRHSIDSEEILNRLSPNPEVEEVTYRSGALLWSAQISNLPRTDMLKVSGQKIYQEVTIRNLNTTRKLLDLMTKIASA